MINYKNGKTRYVPNNLGSLYVDESSLNSNEQPVIYIGGQMEHRCHILEQSGYTADEGHNMFNGSWFYDYPLFSADKKHFNGENFAQNLLKAIEEAKLHDVVLVTESYGGTIAAYASPSDSISKVIAIHPSITRTPLANPKFLDMYKEQFTPSEKAILAALHVAINPEYGFERDNFLGINPKHVDLNKLLVVGSSIDPETEKNPLLRHTYNIIQKVTSRPSDGVVTFDPEQLEQLGINYLVEDERTNHLQANSKDHIAKVYSKVMKN